MRKHFLKIIQTIFAIVIALIMFFPVIIIIGSSIKDLPDISSYPPTLFPENFQWDNFVTVLQTGNVPLYFRNTLILIIGNVVGTLLSSAIVAYPLARMQFRGKNFIFGLIIATMMVPATTTIIPQFVLFSKLKWIDSFLPLIVPAFFAYPYNVFLFRQFFMTIPKGLDEAARIDGCNRLQIFTYILVPLSKPIFITIGVMCSVSWWNELFSPMIYINSDVLKPLTVGALSVFKSHFQFVTMWNLEMALALIMIIPPIVLYLFAQNYLVEGIKTAGIKG
ncbi:MAG: carbohydrate ABC transporter permease [Clostridiales bacterium]|nr:carbohydrate ABC transporter permease [Clostridiales bacterium]